MPLCRDHAGGNEEIAKLIPGIEIVGGEHEHVSAATTEVADMQEISVGSISIKCLETPFHTLGHMCVRKLHSSSMSHKFES